MNVERLNITLKADPGKVILQFFELKNDARIKKILNRVTSLPESEVNKKLSEVYSFFGGRHKNLDETFSDHFTRVENLLEDTLDISDNMKKLIGAYFTKEYSIESAALFNPSIVTHPDQSGTEEGEVKFVMSLRAAGEGHISSVEFREGIISKNADISFINDSDMRVLPKQKEYPVDEIIGKKFPGKTVKEKKREKLLSKNYRCLFGEDTLMSERVLFPNSISELMGIEDARFVKFEEGYDYKYLATYTAYNGKSFKSQLIETTDFKEFELGTLHGKMIKDKGMAIFPRKIDGKYFMTSRLDGENMYMMESNNLYRWDNAELIMEPESSWEFVQLGNCGSPIETELGWLLLTHAVGPFRKYVISALLLDKENPYKVIGKLKEPLIEPEEPERDGYVPNVVYSCGSLIHNNNLIIPFAMSDSACGFAKIELNKLLENIQHT